jgi:hypothetical protein
MAYLQARRWADEFKVFHSFSLVKTEVLETVRTCVVLLKFAIYSEGGKVGKSALLAPRGSLLGAWGNGVVKVARFCWFEGLGMGDKGVEIKGRELVVGK